MDLACMNYEAGYTEIQQNINEKKKNPISQIHLVKIPKGI